MTALEELKAVRAVLHSREAWTKLYYARNADGKFADVLGPDACKFCIMGAFRKVNGTDGPGPTDDTPGLDIVVRESYRRGFGAPATFNDAFKTTFEDVASLLDTCIEKAS